MPVQNQQESEDNASATQSASMAHENATSTSMISDDNSMFSMDENIKNFDQVST